MKLTFVEKTSKYVLTVPRGSKPTALELMQSSGLDMSSTRSTNAEACLFTDSPYTAAPFVAHGDDHVKQKLAWITNAVTESWAKGSAAHIDCPADKELWGFQKANVSYLKRRGGGLVGDQPGLGKTPTAICYANEIHAKRVLVICPASIRLQWATRIREWTQMRWPYTVYPILNSSRGVHPLAQWTIVSYDLARTPAIGRALAKGTYDLLILDEAHMLKTIESNRTRAVFGDLETETFRHWNKETEAHEFLFNSLASRCGSVISLTGTPLPNRPREAYTLARAHCWDAIDFLSFDAFSERFNPIVKREGVRKDGTSFVYNDERSGRHQELQYRLRANFMTRHMKRGPDGVADQLKLPVYDLIVVDKTGAVKQALEAESLLDIDPDTLDVNNTKIMGHLAVVRRLMGIAIAPQVANWVDMLIDGGETKIVVFAWHIEVLNILERLLGKHGVVRIDGRVQSKDKQERIDEFIRNPKKNVIVGNMQAMGLGTDGLQGVANHALLAEPDWVPGNNEQAVDRLDRFGQERTVMADIFVAPDSIAEKILSSALKKAGNIHTTLDKRLLSP